LSSLSSAKLVKRLLPDPDRLWSNYQVYQVYSPGKVLSQVSLESFSLTDNSHQDEKKDPPPLWKRGVCDQTSVVYPCVQSKNSNTEPPPQQSFKSLALLTKFSRSQTTTSRLSSKKESLTRSSLRPFKISTKDWGIASSTLFTTGKGPHFSTPLPHPLPLVPFGHSALWRKFPRRESLS